MPFFVKNVYTLIKRSNILQIPHVQVADVHNAAVIGNGRCFIARRNTSSLQEPVRTAAVTRLVMSNYLSNKEKDTQTRH